ncbi:spindle and kinetochore-associated protein 1-like [Bradysia coprophila]|uniref:spindle and kinetochore-associated protein 1-like n=1 Tax=Bradysia coprophila TaxID=38358 RepID=UPI00187DCD7B|nr:spindle and kinetochore-associated protein 1-like [Bradysia coprophila]
MSDMSNNDDPPNPVVLKPRRELIIEDIQTEMDIQLDKIAVINDFMSLHCERKLIKDDLAQLKERTAELKELVSIAREKVRIFKTVEKAEAETLINDMRNQHLAMMQKLEELDNSENDSYSSSGRSQHEQRTASPVQPSTPKQNRMTFTVKVNTITPKRHQSPFGLRVDPRCLGVLKKQFQLHIDPSEFDRIPKYMRGRDSLDELTTFLETVIVKCFINKYTLLHRDRENVQPGEMTRWQMYRSQMEYFPGDMFITEGDISTLLGRMMDKKMNNRIAMLRHLNGGIIQEVRRGMATCYIWKGKK